MWQLPQQDDTAADDSRNSRQQQQQQQQHETEVVIRCNASGEQWRLRCRDNSWVGQLGNCSSSAASAKRESRHMLPLARKHRYHHPARRLVHSTRSGAALNACKPMGTFASHKLESADQGCSPKKEVGGRLKQDLDKDFKTILAYIHVHSYTSEKLPQQIFGLVLRYSLSATRV